MTTGRINQVAFLNDAITALAKRLETMIAIVRI